MPQSSMLRRLAVLAATTLSLSLAQWIGPPTPLLGSTPAQAAVGLRPGAGQFYPARWRAANNVSVPANTTVTVQVTGAGGVPAATQVSAVALNLTATGSGGNGSLAVIPSGAAQPVTRAVSYRSGARDANLVMAATGADGKVAIRNTGAVAATITADVHGWFAATSQATAGSTVASLTPARIASWVTVPANGSHILSPLGQGGLPAGGVAAVLATITAYGDVNGQVTAFASGTTKPSIANLPYGGGVVTQNLVIAALGGDGKVVIANEGNGSLVMWVDVVGYLSSPSGTHPGAATIALPPARIDTNVSIPAKGNRVLSPLGAGGVPAGDVAGIGLNVTVRGSGSGAINVFPSGATDPDNHTVSYLSGVDASGFTIARLGTDGKVVVHNKGDASVTVQLDVYGYLRAPTKPGVPKGVVAYPLDAAAIIVWQPPDSDGGATLAHYIVAASPGNASAWVAGDATGAGLTGLTNGQEYTFTVTAVNYVNGGSVSAPSAPSIPVTPAAPRTPGAPLITEVHPRDMAIRVSWSPPETGAKNVTKYVVTATPGDIKVDAPATATEATVPGLTNGTRYTFTVAAVNAHGSSVSARSGPVAPVPAVVPLRPVITSAIAGNQKIDVQWSPPADGGSAITGYTVSASPGGPTLQIPAGTTVAALTGLTNGTTYTVSVQARNKAGLGLPGTMAAKPEAARVPTAATDIRASVTANGTVQVSWSHPVDTGTAPIGGYGIKASPGNAGTIAPPTATSATISGLDPSVAYSFTVIAVNSVGQGPASVGTTPIQPRLTIRKTPKVLSNAAISTLRQQHTDGTLDFEQPPAEVTGLAVGDLVVAPVSPKTPRGFYGRVTAINQLSGLFVVSTALPGLTEAFSEGAYAMDTTLDTADIDSFTPLTPGVKLSKPSVRDGVEIKDGKLVISLSKTIGAPNGMTAGKIDATFSVEPHATTTASIGTGGISTDTKVSLEYVANATGNIGPLSWTHEWPVAKLEGKCWTVMVGPVPVVVCPQFEMKVKVTITAGGGVELDVFYGREVGVRLQTQNTSVSVEAINQANPANHATVKPFGKFEATLGLPMSGALYLYGVIGPGLRAEPFVKGVLNPTGNPCWTISAGVKVDAFFKVNLPLGLTLDWERPGLVDESRPVKDSGGPCAGITVQPETAVTGIGQPVQFRVEYLGVTPPTAPITWRVHSGPGTIDSTGRYVHNADGYAIVEATRAAQAPLPEFKARAAVVVGTPPPGPPTITTITARPFAAELTWTPPVLPPGQSITEWALVTDPPTTTTFVPGAQTRAFVTGLTAGEQYRVRIYAKAGTLTGTPSDWAGPVTPLESPFRHGSATDLTPDNTGDAGKHGTALSGNGRYLFFAARANSSLAPPEIYDPEAGNLTYLIRQDLKTFEIVVASRDPEGKPKWLHSDIPWQVGPVINSSYDGNKVVFRTVHQGLPMLLWTDIPAKQTRVIHRDTTLTDTIGMPKISDDGSVVVFAARLNDNQGRALYRSVNGTPGVRIDRCPDQTNCHGGGYDMSGDGNRVVYQADFAEADRSATHILLYNAVNGSTTNLTAGQIQGEYFRHPLISGDGTTWTATYAAAPPGQSGIVRKRIGEGRPGLFDMIMTTSVFGQGGEPAAISRDGNAIAIQFKFTVGPYQGYVWRNGSYQRLPHDGNPDGIEWGLDITADGTKVVYGKAVCPSVVVCNALPGVHGMKT